MFLNYSINAILKNAPENIDSRVLSPMNLGAFTFSKRMPNEDEYSHYMRGVITNYVNGHVPENGQSWAYVKLCDQLLKTNTLPMFVFGDAENSCQFQISTQYTEDPKKSENWPMDFPIVLQEFVKLFDVPRPYLKPGYTFYRMGFVIARLAVTLAYFIQKHLGIKE